MSRSCGSRSIPKPLFPDSGGVTLRQDTSICIGNLPRHVGAEHESGEETRRVGTNPGLIWNQQLNQFEVDIEPKSLIKRAKGATYDVIDKPSYLTAATFGDKDDVISFE